MSCCGHAAAVDRRFDAQVARAELKRYRRRGPEATTRVMLALLVSAGLPPAGTMLDIGGGVGALHHALLDKGLARAVHVDASSAYLRAAAEEADRRAHAGRVTFRQGDLRAIAAELAPADVVTLDRVVCCDPDPTTLLPIAAARTRRFLALSYPHDTWYAHLSFWGLNAWRVLRRDPFRAFVHAPSAMAGIIRGHGLRLRAGGGDWFWAVELYERTA